MLNVCILALKIICHASQERQFLCVRTHVNKGCVKLVKKKKRKKSIGVGQVARCLGRPWLEHCLFSEVLKMELTPGSFPLHGIMFRSEYIFPIKKKQTGMTSCYGKS